MPLYLWIGTTCRRVSRLRPWRWRTSRDLEVQDRYGVRSAHPTPTKLSGSRLPVLKAYGSSEGP